MQPGKRVLNYSMPLQNGLYPPPPYIYRGMRALVLLFQADPAVKRRFLPPEHEPVEYGLDALFFSAYPDSTIGPYNENLVLLSCTCPATNEAGLHVLNIYVDGEEALTAGREIWGYPKKMCHIEVSAVDDQTRAVTAKLTRKGVTFLDVEAELVDRPPGMDPAELVGGSPLFNIKLIPDVADPEKPALRQLTRTQLTWENFSRKSGAKAVRVTTRPSDHDVCHEALEGAQTDLGGFFVVCDQLLPAGSVVR
ncbi:MAG: hypothetical protein Kow0069_14130 [Promethearchaeota archaeon]